VVVSECTVRYRVVFYVIIFKILSHRNVLPLKQPDSYCFAFVVPLVGRRNEDVAATLDSDLLYKFEHEASTITNINLRWTDPRSSLLKLPFKPNLEVPDEKKKLNKKL